MLCLKLGGSVCVRRHATQQQGQVRRGYSVGVWQLNGRLHDFGQGQNSPYLGLAQFHYRGFDCDADELPDDADYAYLIGAAPR